MLEQPTYDLASNRVGRRSGWDANGDGLISGSEALDQTLAYAYNERDQLTVEGPDANADGIPDSATTSNYYDRSGSLTKSTTGTQSSLYLWDLRNRLAAVDGNGDDLAIDSANATSGSVNDAADASYVYDSAGVRVSESSGGSSIYYLSDANNLSGYAKAIEEKASPAGSPIRSYILGDGVIGQRDAANGTLYLISDGHGSTRALADGSGGLVERYDYDAFGTLLASSGAQSDPAAARTVWLFGGDGVYDARSGWTYQLARWRSGFRFTSMDTYAGDSQDPLSLHKYLYVNADPVNGWDPSGQMLGMLGGLGIGEYAEASEGGAAIGFANIAMNGLKPAIAMFNAVQGGVINATMSGNEWAASFAIGFTSSLFESTLSLAGLPCYMAAGIGGAVLSVGNDYLAKGSLSWEGLGSALVDGVVQGLVTAVFGNSCFVAGTPVLLGDGQTKEAIDQIHVGQRVATDGGVATSADGGTAAADPNATEVDPATWRLVTIEAEDWEVQSLVSLDWINAHGVISGGSLPLSEVVDLAEMGVPDNLSGTVESISLCPPIEGSYGRVVLTTVSHLNNFVYNLTLSESDGTADSLGVTGYHRFYTEDRGWVIASELYLGETVRTARGDATVTSLVRDPGVYRVYNMTVEADHDYYVGDLTALVHNSCSSDAKELRKALLKANQDEMTYAAHLVPSNKSGAMFDQMREWIEKIGGKNSAANGFFTDSTRHDGTHTMKFLKKLYSLLEKVADDPDGMKAVLAEMRDAARAGHY